jgi:NADPH:quinone reductase-like Zn-dependent oxidoreductase
MTTMMRAAIYRTYGPPEVVRVEQISRPEPTPDEVLIRTIATTVSSGDWRARSLAVPAGFGPLARPAFGLFGPRKPILGTELSGIVEAIGAHVTRFKVGDEVFAFPSFALGAHAEYKTMPQDGLIAHKPANLSFEQAAALCFGGTTALYYLRDLAKLRPDERVLILGGAGAVGSAAIQIARHLGAHVCATSSERNLATLQHLGAYEAIDYARHDPLTSCAPYDVIFDTVGVTTIAAATRALTPTGRLLLCAATLPQLLYAQLSPRVLAGNTPERPEDLLTLATLAQQGHLTPLIDRAYPLDQITLAHQHVDRGHKRGSIIIAMTHPPQD